MKTKFSNKELPHIWANQKQESGKGNNMFFEGTKIYSYGEHFVIAELLPNNICLFNSDGYSPSTSKHMFYVSRAIPDSYKVFEVPGCKLSHKVNFEYFKTQFEDSIRQAAKATKYKLQCLNSAKLYVQQIEDYLQAFNLKAKNFEGIPAILKQKDSIVTPEIEEQIRVANHERQLKAIENSKVDIEKWIAGNKDSLSNKIDKVFLRIKDDNVETSKGARVSLKAAMILYKLIVAGKDIKGHDIDGYTVISINGVLKIGCHEIERSEIDRFVKTQNW